MALISCPECNKQISDKAKFCPQCGFPLIEERVDDLISNPKKDEEFKEKNYNSSYAKEKEEIENRIAKWEEMERLNRKPKNATIIIIIIILIFINLNTCYSTLYNS